MKTWEFEKTAGIVLDQQDDPGVWFEKFAEFWPEDLDTPDLGVEVDDKHCIAALQSGHTKLARYPTHTPEDALASSMYFLACGIEPIEKNAHKTIAQGLKNGREAWGVEIPDGFLGFVKQAHAPVEQEEAFADDHEHLPVTTREQCAESIDVFEKHASKWDPSDRLIIGRRLKEAADIHGVDQDIPYSSEEMSKHASGALNMRKRLMESMAQHPYKTEYLSSIDNLKTDVDGLHDYDGMIRIVERLESIDKEAELDLAWGEHFPDPADTFLEGVSEEVFPEIEKRASYEDIDFSGLKDTFKDHIVEEIEKNPEEVIPTLPDPQRNLVEDYIDERRR